jgi:outer membrane lipoprotein SlyB
MIDIPCLKSAGLRFQLTRRTAMKMMNKFAVVFAITAVLALAGCGTMNDPFNNSSPAASDPASDPGTVNSGSAYSGYGVVHSIELVQGTTANTGIGGSGIGIGAIAGAVVGGVLGNQVGGGTGQTVATVAGAAGGAYVGNEIEKRQKQQTADAYKITVRMNGGSYQTVTQNTNTGLRVGDRVRIDNGNLQRY